MNGAFLAAQYTPLHKFSSYLSCKQWNRVL
jgi:hypothetical protein